VQRPAIPGKYPAGWQPGGKPELTVAVDDYAKLPGLYGSFPWLDSSRGYGASFALEADGNVGAALWTETKPTLVRIVDPARR